MSSEDESEDVEDQEKTDEKEDLPSSRQAKKVARLNQILYESEHKAKISKVCEKKILLLSCWCVISSNSQTNTQTYSTVLRNNSDIKGKWMNIKLKFHAIMVENIFF